MKPRRHIGQGRSGIPVAAMLLGVLGAAPAHASGSLSCSLVVTSLTFGGYVPFSAAPTEVNATITVNCTATGSTAVPLLGSISLTSASPSYSRQLTDGTYALRYHTYQNAGRTMFWGNGSGLGGTVTVSGAVSPGSPFQQAFTVYGLIPARQSSAHVGSYTDMIAVALTY
jgi:spore coat protein U-like protein